LSEIHLVKLSVGSEDIDQLASWQAQKLNRDGRLAHITRNTPKRAEELLEGGSMYWVIKRFIRVRQRLIGIERGVDEEGKPSCALVLDPQLVMTELKDSRPFQGWRYLPGKDAPKDLNVNNRTIGFQEEQLPFEMERELKELGLI